MVFLPHLVLAICTQIFGSFTMRQYISSSKGNTILGKYFKMYKVVTWLLANGVKINWASEVIWYMMENRRKRIL